MRKDGTINATPVAAVLVCCVCAWPRAWPAQSTSPSDAAQPSSSNAANDAGPEQNRNGLPAPLPPPLSTLPGRNVPAETTPARLPSTSRFQAAPFDQTDVRFPITLAAALRLSDARPLIVAAAQAGVWVAEAELTRAKVLWLPAAEYRLRLHPPRRRRPRLQQGHPYYPQRELLLRWWRPLG